MGLKEQGARGSKNILNELKSPQRLAGHVRPNSSRAELKRTSEGRPQESAILLVRWPTLKLLEFTGKRWGAGPGWEFQVVDRREACAQGLYGQLPSTASLRTPGLSVPGVRRAARPACPAASPARAPTRPPTPPRSAAWPGPPRVGKGSWGAYLRAPRAARRAPGKRRAARGGRPRAAPSRRAVSGPRRALPARATARRAPRSLERGGVPSRGARRGGALLIPAAVARGQRRWAAPGKSDGARVWAPRPCRRQRGQGGGGPLPCLQIWSSVCLNGRERALGNRLGEK